MSEIISALSRAGLSPWLIPMHPSPRADTSRPLVPNARFCINRDPYDRRLSDLIGELSTRSEEFRVRWAAHNVKFHRTGVKRLHHPLVGELTLMYEALELAADAGQRILVYTAEPDSRSHEAMSLLASWSSTPNRLPATEPGKER